MKKIILFVLVAGCPATLFIKGVTKEINIELEVERIIQKEFGTSGSDFLGQICLCCA